MRIGFVRWISAAPSGGNVYDDALTTGLRSLGMTVQVRRIDGSAAQVKGRAQLAAALETESASLVDGILAIDAPDLITGAVAAGRSVTVLVHHFAADDPRLDETARGQVADAEAEALRAATGVLCTSRWAAAELQRRYGLTDVGVAPPGVDLAPLAAGSRRRGAPQVLSVGSLTPLKDQLRLLAALARLADLDWVASLVGSDTADRAYAGRVSSAAAEAGLSGRVQVVGARVGAALETEWRATDLLVQTSRSETYGIAVLEARARGVPAVVSSGTGMVEALTAGSRDGQQAGAAVDTADPEALAAILRRWLMDAELASRWRSAALEHRKWLPRWTSTAAMAKAYMSRALS